MIQKTKLSEKLSHKNLRWLPWAFMGIILALSLAIGIIDNDKPKSAEERSASIARTIRCPQCSGETVAESNAPIAQEIRAEIRVQVSEGKTADEIRNFMANSYGRDILLIPPALGVGSTIWIIPIAGLCLALGLLGVAFWKWQKELDFEQKDDEDEEELRDDEFDEKEPAKVEA